MPANLAAKANELSLLPVNAINHSLGLGRTIQACRRVNQSYLTVWMPGIPQADGQLFLRGSNSAGKGTYIGTYYIG
jgi:hypothetical protein